MAEDAASSDGRASSRESRTLRRIADALGLPVAALVAPAEPHVLHASTEGARWLLLRDARGIPIVRHLPSPTGGQRTADASVAVFLTRDVGSPQHRALTALIEKVLTAYLAC